MSAKADTASRQWAMKNSQAREYVFVLSTALSLAESAHASGGPSAIGYAILFVAAMNVLSTPRCWSAASWGYGLLRHKRAIGLSLIVLAALPFLHYAVTVIRAQSEPARRHEQIAELMQQREVPRILRAPSR